MSEQAAEQYHPGLVGAQQAAAIERPAQARQVKYDPGFPVGWLIAPATAWLLVFLVLPLVGIIVFSFWESTGHGMAPALSGDAYAAYFLNEGFFDAEHRNYLTPSIFIKTLWSTFYYAAFITAMCVLVGYPIAYFLAAQVTAFKWQLALFLLAMVPFWTSYLIRAVAWLPMLGRRGMLNEFLLFLGVIDKPSQLFLYSELGYLTALVQLYVVLAVGPIFFSLAKIDNAIVEAARDMGATSFQIFREITLPLSLPGVAIGSIFVFVMVMGEFATAVVVYGGKATTVGTVILNYYAIANYPFAAVNALMLMVAMMIGVVVILRVVDIRKEL
ncbi:MAG: ABC transporter permease [Alphaproteobacteria bacterium]